MLQILRKKREIAYFAFVADTTPKFPHSLRWGTCKTKGPWARNEEGDAFPFISFEYTFFYIVSFLPRRPGSPQCASNHECKATETRPKCIPVGNLTGPSFPPGLHLLPSSITGPRGSTPTTSCSCSRAPSPRFVVRGGCCFAARPPPFRHVKAQSMNGSSLSYAAAYGVP